MNLPSTPGRAPNAAPSFDTGAMPQAWPHAWAQARLHLFSRPGAKALGMLALTLAMVSAAQAAEPAASSAPDDASPYALVARGPYVGLGVGMSKLGPRHEGSDSSGDSGHGGLHLGKLYGGYQLNDTWGLEAGMVRLGRAHDDRTATDGSTVKHSGDAHTLYLAGTGRYALGAGFSLTGKAGVSFGHVDGQDSADSANTLGGDRASLLLGIGAQYQVNRNMALTLDFDDYGKVSDKVKASAVSVGLRYNF